MHVEREGKKPLINCNLNRFLLLKIIMEVVELNSG